jgi:hypothetical protein
VSERGGKDRKRNGMAIADLSTGPRSGETLLQISGLPENEKAFNRQ